MWNPYDFSGKRIIVTGATSGMGKATSIRLSEQGAEVCIVGRNREKLNETMELLQGPGHMSYQKDLSEAGGAKELFEYFTSDGRKIDGLVYCAGIATILPATRLSKKSMDECFTTNFFSYVEMASMMSKNKYHSQPSSIVGVSSISIKYPQKCQGLYVATKAAMTTISSAMALELGEKGIRINTVLPANTRTKMLEEAFEEKGDDYETFVEKEQILGISTPEDIAEIILFLLSDASRMITGREIYADGGYLNFHNEKDR